MHWWQRWPERYEHELRALEDAGIPFVRDEAAFGAGVLRLSVTPTVDGRPRKLVATFPDLYPYFRFEVQAADEDLPYHQNPHGRNLCLLGRATENWRVGDTLAGLLSEQLPKVFAAALAPDAAAAAPLEEHQAEPYSEYYPYQRAILLVDNGWTIPKDVTSGTLKIGTNAQQASIGGPELRGAVLQVLAGRGEILAEAHPALRSLYGPPTITARWVRAAAPIPEFDPGRFIAAVHKLDPGAAGAPTNPLASVRLQVWGVVFPEELAHRSPGDGWAFACRFQRPSVLPPFGVTPGSPSRAKGR